MNHDDYKTRLATGPGSLSGLRPRGNRKDREARFHRVDLDGYN